MHRRASLTDAEAATVAANAARLWRFSIVEIESEAESEPEEKGGGGEGEGGRPDGGIVVVAAAGVHDSGSSFELLGNFL